MPSPHSLTDNEFIVNFENLSIAPHHFTHKAHIRLAWIHINKYGIDKATVNIVHQIKNFVTHLNAQDKFNHTLTVAAVKTVHHFIKKTHTNNFQDFLNQNPRLLSSFKELIYSHYSNDLIHSAAAKNAYLEPDLQSFN